MNNLNHVAIILDGNRRYAESLNKDYNYGHFMGMKNIIPIVKRAIDKKISYLTFFCFSTENWKRDLSEIENIFRYISENIKNISNEIGDFYSKVRLKILSLKLDESKNKRIKEYDEMMSTLKKIQEYTKNNSELVLTFAINYGGKDEIIETINKMQPITNTITLKEFEDNLNSSFLPNIDILIRTSGEKRISNFMLWKLAYSELFFIDKFWPSFTVDDFDEVIYEYKNKRIRRYGGH